VGPQFGGAEFFLCGEMPNHRIQLLLLLLLPNLLMRRKYENLNGRRNSYLLTVVGIYEGRDYADTNVSIARRIVREKHKVLSLIIRGQ
jgi:hypothetical protein